jgi:putative heme-binding domain-containing protein
MRSWTAAICVLFGLLAGEAPAQEQKPKQVIPHRQDRIPNRPLSPEEAVEAMTVPAGFTVEVVASEPDIVNPIAMTFDDQGRIWVTESIEYPRKDPGPGRDRVKVLEDIDGDGRAEKVTTFADGLNIPTGVACGYDGVWVLNAPDLLLLKDSDGDQRADHREVVLTGFGRADLHELPSTLTWGPDGWLYGFNGVFNPSRIVSGGKKFAFTCALWRVHPRTREFQVFSQGTSNPYGLAWDREGSAIVEACHWANDHLFHFVETGYYTRQAGPYPPYTFVLGSITDHSHQKTAYCGLAYFDSEAYPPAFRDRLYTGNIHGGCINTDRLTRDGSTYQAHAESDFLVANDAWFMPVAQKVGPDGCLYILDWYDRYHCYQDANRDPEGIDRLKGRLYRVRYRNSPRAPRFNLARETDDDLIQRLSSSNIYFREAAQRLLTERNTPDIRTKLRRLALNDAQSGEARRHGLWALIGMGRLEPDLHRQLLLHSGALFRAWAVRAAGESWAVEPAIRDAVARLAHDRSRDVQLQVAIAATKIDGLDPLPVLVDVLSACGDDRLISAIVWQNLHGLLPAGGRRFVELIEQLDLKKCPAVAKLLPRVVDRMMGENSADLRPVAEILERLLRHDTERGRECLAVIAERLNEMPDARKACLKDELQPVIRRLSNGDPSGPLAFDAQLLAWRLGFGSLNFEVVRVQFVGADRPDSVRVQALDALIAFRDTDLATAVDQVLASGSSALVARVLATLGRSFDPKIGQVVLTRLPQLAPEIKPLAIELLLQRESWTRKLVDAVVSSKLPSTTLDANHLRKILESNDREAIWIVEKAWGTIRAERDPAREKVVRAMGDYLRSHPGDARAGREVFRKLCIQCHTIYGEGQTVGPDLTSNGRGSFDQLLASIFDPSLVIGPSYQTTTVVTEGGRSLSGLLVEESDQRIVLKLAGGSQEAIPRNDVKWLRASKLSMMPEGIEALLGKAELADLFAFLALDRPPEDPRARPIPGAPPLSPP